MHFTCRSFIGKQSETVWAQYWENEPDDPLIVAKRGHLFGLIKTNPDLGRDLITKIDEAYFSNFDQENIQDHLQQILTTITKDLEEDSQTIILITVVFKNHLFLASYGQGNIILSRDHQISRLLSNDKNEIKTISGPFLPGDKILLITNSFLDKLTWDRLKTTISNASIQSIEENFFSELYSFDNQPDLAAALIQIHSDIDDSLKNSPSNVSSSDSSKKQSVYVATHQTNQVNKRRRINILVALILLLGFAVSSYFGFIKNKKTQAESQFQQIKTELDKKISDALAIKNLNINSAQELGRQSQDLLKKISQLKNHQEEIKSYQEKITSLLSQTGSSSENVSTLFYDTSLITSNPQFSKIIFKNNLLYLLDPVSGRLDSVDTNLKNISNIAINDKIKNTLNLAENNGNLFLVNSNNISLINKSDITPKINFSEISQGLNPISIASWNSAFYVLDSKNLTIWKFNPNASGFGPGEIWLKDNLKLSDKISSLAINGKIWVLSSNGQILPFSRGVKENFKSAQAINFTNAANLVVAIDADFLAFTDSDNLIYVYKKSGELISKYNLGDKKIKSIALDEKSKIIFILCSDQKIYKITL